MFNVTNRLVVLFLRIDVDPVDGFVTKHKLTQWNLQQAEREVMHRSDRTQGNGYACKEKYSEVRRDDVQITIDSKALKDMSNHIFSPFRNPTPRNIFVPIQVAPKYV
ncbi:hypothetical protein CFP56_040857 [Quercus suber]|uniref:Uncharacterized protein n=1 Tax=Quercus suber TaxID=58331 RepID=A0AAW0IXE3_QUESU